MGKTCSEISDKLAEFMAQQPVFFVGTAAAEGRVNVSPKGMDTLRVLDKNRIIWLSVTGSGNETSAHIQQNGRMTLMFCAFEGNPIILRIYGHAKVIHQKDAEWENLYALFNSIPGARQIFDLSVDLVQTSCGMAVPFLAYQGEREQLIDWAVKKGQDGIHSYWQEKNQTSIDGIPTHIVEKNL